jgi:small subunit ribosomal protein S20
LTDIFTTRKSYTGAVAWIFSKKREIFLKLGIDFIGKGRYNVELYERLQTGGVTEMPNIKSSKKDVIRSKIAYEKNKADKSALKTALKKYDAALVAGDKAAAEVAYKVAVKAVDQAVIKGLLHKNNAARKKSSMTLKLNAMA